MEINEREFTIIKCEPNRLSLPFKESQLLEGLTPELAHADLVAIPLTINDKEPLEASSSR